LTLLEQSYGLLSMDIYKNITYGNIEIEICKFITMQHMYNVELLSDEERRALEEKKIYQDELKNQVLDMIRVKELANKFKSDISLLSYKPGNFYIYVGAKYINNVVTAIIEEHEGKINNFGGYVCYGIMIIVDNIMTIMLLMESANMIQAFSILRNLIEFYISFILCYTNNNLINEYLKYQTWLEEFEKTNEYPRDFIKKYDEETIQILPKPSKINFLHYGWITEHLKKIRKRDVKYTFRDVANLTEEYVGKGMYSAYEHCCQFTHTNYMTKDMGFAEPEMEYIRYHCCSILIKIIDVLKNLASVEFVVNGVNIEQKVKDIMKVLNERRNNYYKY